MNKNSKKTPLKKSKSKSQRLRKMRKSKKNNKQRKTRSKNKSVKKPKIVLEDKPSTFANIFSLYRQPVEPVEPVKMTIPVKKNKETHKPKLILIHAHWCGHCVRLMPNWDQMNDHLIKHNIYNKDDIHKIESQEMNQLDDINKKYVIEEDIRADGYPTIGKLVNGRFERYQGDRDTDSLIQWAGKQ